jgi:hypothetical protein
VADVDGERVIGDVADDYQVVHVMLTMRS